MSKLKMLIFTMKSRRKLKKYNVRLSPLAIIDAKCSFGSNIYIDRFCNLHDTRIGDCSSIGWSSFTDQCDIGKYCSIAPNVSIGVSSHPISRVSTSPVFYAHNNTGTCLIKDDSVVENCKTIIGNDVWIGTFAVIKGGATIGNGAVIAAGAVVTKDVPPYAIVGGVPAKVIRYRFDEDTSRKLNDSKWWEWPIEKILKYQDVFNDGVEFSKIVSAGSTDRML